MKLLKESFTIRRRLKQFLQQEDIKDALDNLNFEYIYECLQKTTSIQHDDINTFTQLMFALNKNPLDYMTYIPAHFMHGSKATNFSIPSHITEIRYCAFDLCEKLTSIVIPKSVTIIEDGVFYNCKALTSVTFEDGSQLTEIGNHAFQACKNLTNINLDKCINLTTI